MSEEQQQLAVGTKVWYVPHEDHWNDQDRNRAPVFEFVHHEQSRAQPGQPREAIRIGQAVVNHQNQEVHGPFMRDHSLPGVVLRTGKGHVLKMTRPRVYWQAEVIRVNKDGSADLVILHPNGHELHTKPDREAMKARGDDLRSLLAREEASFQTLTGDERQAREFELNGQGVSRDEWRAGITAMIADPEDLQAHPGIRYDPKKALHTFHHQGE